VSRGREGSASGRGGGSKRARGTVGAFHQSASVALSGGGTLGSFKSSTARDTWAGRADVLGELRVAELGITVGVHAADDSEKLGLAGVVATVTEEGSEVESVDSSVVVTIDAAVSGEGREVVSHLELTLEDVKTTGEVDFLLEDVEEGSLDIVRERVETANAEGRSVKSDVSQEVVSAGEEHLEEAIAKKKSISIRMTLEEFSNF